MKIIRFVLNDICQYLGNLLGIKLKMVESSSDFVQLGSCLRIQLYTRTTGKYWVSCIIVCFGGLWFDATCRVKQTNTLQAECQSTMFSQELILDGHSYIVTHAPKVALIFKISEFYRSIAIKRFVNYYYMMP